MIDPPVLVYGLLLTSPFVWFVVVLLASLIGWLIASYNLGE